MSFPSRLSTLRQRSTLPFSPSDITILNAALPWLKTAEVFIRHILQNYAWFDFPQDVNQGNLYLVGYEDLSDEIASRTSRSQFPGGLGSHPSKD
jgi:hypothetical protein